MALVYPAPLPILAYLATGSSGGPLCSGRVAHFASGTLAQFGPENAYITSQLEYPRKTLLS